LSPQVLLAGTDRRRPLRPRGILRPRARWVDSCTASPRRRRNVQVLTGEVAVVGMGIDDRRILGIDRLVRTFAPRRGGPFDGWNTIAAGADIKLGETTCDI